MLSRLLTLCYHSMMLGETHLNLTLLGYGGNVLLKASSRATLQS
jgi:hypothetical protein